MEAQQMYQKMNGGVRGLAEARGALGAGAALVLSRACNNPTNEKATPPFRAVCRKGCTDARPIEQGDAIGQGLLMHQQAIGRMSGRRKMSSPGEGCGAWRAPRRKAGSQRRLKVGLLTNVSLGGR